MTIGVLLEVEITRLTSLVLSFCTFWFDSVVFALPSLTPVVDMTIGVAVRYYEM